MTDQTTPIDPTQTTDGTGNGNPPPKLPPKKEDPLTTESVDDTGNGNPPPKG